jgi:VanZ family protein
MRSVFLRRPAAEELEALGRARRFLVVWLPALIGVAVIIAESTPTFSATKTSRILRPLIEWLFGRLSDPVWDEVHHLLRKAGHFVGYGTLCVLFLRAWLLSLAMNVALQMRAWWLRSWGYAVASTFVVASGDEIHQSFLPSRTGMFSDVVLDTVGGIVVSGLVLWICPLIRDRINGRLRRDSPSR